MTWILWTFRLPKLYPEQDCSKIVEPSVACALVLSTLLSKLHVSFESFSSQGRSLLFFIRQFHTCVCYSIRGRDKYIPLLDLALSFTSLLHLLNPFLSFDIAKNFHHEHQTPKYYRQ
jgi:hypothetical protein